MHTTVLQKEQQEKIKWQYPAYILNTKLEIVHVIHNLFVSFMIKRMNSSVRRQKGEDSTSFSEYISCCQCYTDK